MKGCHFIYEILTKQDFYLFQFKIAEPVSQLPIYIIREKKYFFHLRKVELYPKSLHWEDTSHIFL